MNHTWINAMRVKSDRQAVALTRSHFSGLLSNVDLHPPGLPPTTVLIVRRLEDPQPGRIVDGWSSVKVRREWERRARDRLTELYHHAIHPSRQVVPAAAEAVVFSDEGEMLACLLRDLTRGDVLQRWWWQSILHSGWAGRKPSSHGEVQEAAVRQMTQKANLVPGILAHLEVWGQAVRVVQILSTEQAGRVLQAVLQAYQLPQLLQGSIPGGPSLPPWRPRWMNPLLGKEHAALLGLGLDLQERPQIVRAVSYQEQMRSWWRAAGSAVTMPQQEVVPSVGTAHADGIVDLKSALDGRPQKTSSDKDDDGSQISPAKEMPKSTEDHRQSRLAPKETNTSGIPEKQEPMHEPVERPMSDPRRNSADQVVKSAAPQNRLHLAKEADRTPEIQPELDLSESRPQAKPIAWTNVESSTPVLQSEIESLPSESQAELSAWLSGGVPTRLGGVLYLINLMIAFDLPGCFEEDWHLSSRLGPWGLLEVLARALLGKEIVGFEGDPLWVALAQLDGRNAGEPPGVLLPRSRPQHWPEFRLPEQWMSGLPPEATELSVRKPRSRRYQTMSASPWLRRWLDLALPFIAYRLRLGLHLSPDASLAEFLLILPGRLYVTSSHVDLASSVEQISLPVRLAGLDRDPGWRPEFGRVVSFHFLA